MCAGELKILKTETKTYFQHILCEKLTDCVKRWTSHKAANRRSAQLVLLRKISVKGKRSDIRVPFMKRCQLSYEGESL